MFPKNNMHFSPHSDSSSSSSWSCYKCSIELHGFAASKSAQNAKTTRPACLCFFVPQVHWNFYHSSLIGHRPATVHNWLLIWPRKINDLCELAVCGTLSFLLRRPFFWKVILQFARNTDSSYFHSAKLFLLSFERPIRWRPGRSMVTRWLWGAFCNTL